MLVQLEVWLLTTAGASQVAEEELPPCCAVVEELLPLSVSPFFTKIILFFIPFMFFATFDIRHVY